MTAMSQKRSIHRKQSANGFEVLRVRRRREPIRLAPRFLVRLIGKAKAECLCDDSLVFLRHD